MNKKLLSLALSAICTVAPLAGCANGGSQTVKASTVAAEDYYSYYFDRFGDEVMPIGGYIGPTVGFGYNGTYMESQITDSHYKLVSDCGLNFIVGMKPDYKTHKDDVIKSLQYADAHDVMYFVRDTRLFDVKEDNAANPNNYLYVSLNEFKQMTSEYSSYASFAGLVCRDEPWANMFDQIEEILYFFDQTFDDNKLLYVNSLSYQCPAGWFGSGSTGTENTDMDLDGYMTEWFEHFQTLGYYSYDTYPFITTETGYIRTDIFKNYSIARKYSELNGVPFWTFMQAGGNWGGDTNWRVTNRGEVLWQVNTSLAFGAKGYTWFPYNTPPENIGSPEGDDGLIGRGGQTTPQWYYAQEANKQALACDHILMKSTYKGLIYHLSGLQDTSNAVVMPEEEIIGTSYRQLTSVGGDNAIVGCFNYGGKTALYVVNNSVTKDKAVVELSFDNNYEYEVIQRATSYTVSGNTVKLTFSPGEGACIVLK